MAWLRASPQRRPSRRLARGLALGVSGDRAALRTGGGQRQRLFVVADLQRVAVPERVAGLFVRHLHEQPPAAVAEAEAHVGDRVGQGWAEAQPAVVVAHPAQTGDDADPGTRERGDVHAVAGVVLEVVEVYQRGL